MESILIFGAQYKKHDIFESLWNLLYNDATATSEMQMSTWTDEK